MQGADPVDVGDRALRAGRDGVGVIDHFNKPDALAGRGGSIWSHGVVFRELI